MNMNHEARFIAALAGAGTGKTYSLVENYVSSLFGLDANRERKRPEDIVALTFTEKAAHEMRLRIVKRLNALVHEADSYQDPLTQKAASIGLDMPKSEEIKRIIRAMPNAPIATFHGFASNLLRKYSHQFSCREDFVVTTPKDEITYARNILRPVVLRNINEHEPVLRSLLARFRLSGNELSLGLMDSLLEIYFKMPELGVKIDDLMHKYPKPNVRGHILEIDKYLKIFASIDSTSTTKNRIEKIFDAWSRFKEIVHCGDEHSIAKSFEQVRDSVKGNFGNKEARANLVSAVVNLGVRIVDVFVFDDEIAVAKLMREFDSEFRQFKKQAGLVSYADLLLHVRDGLIGNHALRRTIKNSIKHILVDEYQDTSPLQEDLLALLLENKSREHEINDHANILARVDMSQGPTLFVVGDKKQSIYGFRGADISLFDNMIDKLMSFHDIFDKRLLVINRRSGKNIIGLTNLISGVTLKDQGYCAEHALEAIHDEIDGYCALWVWPEDGKDKTDANLSAAVFGIADLLATHVEIEAKDIVVLVRRIKSAAQIKEKLKGLGIDARVVGGEGFFQQQEIVDILSAFKLVIDPGCELASLVVMRSPFLLFSDQEIFSIRLKMGNLNRASVALAQEQGLLSKQSLARYKEFSAAMSWIESNILSCGFADALDYLLVHTQYSSAIGSLDHAHQKWENIKKLGMLAVNDRGNPYDTIWKFYEQINENHKEPLAENLQHDNAVTIMTIHQSKGLEFKVVVIADGESQLPHTTETMAVDKVTGLAIKPKNRPIAGVLEGSSDKGYARTRFETIRDRITQREHQEMARLLYVAMTRAKAYLFVCCSASSLKSSEKNLVGLFLQAYHRFPEQFLPLCKIVEISEKKKLLHEPKPRVHGTMTLFENKYAQRCIFASALIVEHSDTPWSFKDFSYTKNKIDGELAHQILSHAGRMIFSSSSPISINEAIHAALQSLESFSSDYLDVTKRAVYQTIASLQSIVGQGDQIIFEMPLSCFISEDLMVEGFADMVVISDDYIAVLEFKSSLKSVTSTKTYAQVLSYAHALSSVFDKPIFYSVYLIGTTGPAPWKIYDDAARKTFLHMMSQFNAKAS